MEVDPRWRKASFSDNGGNCVEVGHDGPVVAVRDTENREGPSLAFSASAWRAFAARIKGAQ